MGKDVSAGDALGGFRLVRPTGSGGFAEVWLAEDMNGARVALKVLAPAQGGATALHREWFRREYEVGQSVRSRYVATPFMAQLDADPMWMALPFVEGRTLKQVLDAGPLDGESVKRIAGQMARGLVDIHARGLVHRDIKPSNIMISPGDRVTILDLGVVHDPEWTSLTGLIQPGTMGYLAPESVGSSVTPAVDVWAFSVVLVQMLKPWSVIDDPLEYSLSGVDPGWAALVRACQAPDPWRRPDAPAVVAWIDSGPDAAFDADHAGPVDRPVVLGGQAARAVGAVGLSSAPQGDAGAVVPGAARQDALSVASCSAVTGEPADVVGSAGDALEAEDDRGSESDLTPSGAGRPEHETRSRPSWIVAAGLGAVVLVLLAIALAVGLGGPTGDPATSPPGPIPTDTREPEASTSPEGKKSPPTSTRSPAGPATRPPATPTKPPTPTATPTPTDQPSTDPTPSDPATTNPPSTEPPPSTEAPATQSPTPTPVPVVGAGVPGDQQPLAAS